MAEAETSFPSNIRIGPETRIAGERAFKRFFSQQSDALVIGSHCTMDGVHFAVGKQGRVTIGDHCFFTSAVLLCELELRFGSGIILGWNVTIADSDFHPIDPAERIVDAIACSPLACGHPRASIPCKPVILEDNVWVGPNATILKGVRIGAAAMIEPGAVITRDVPPGARMLGNPAQQIA